MKETWQALNFAKSLLEPLTGFLEKALRLRNQNQKREYCLWFYNLLQLTSTRTYPQWISFYNFIFFSTSYSQWITRFSQNQGYPQNESCTFVPRTRRRGSFHYTKPDKKNRHLQKGSGQFRASISLLPLFLVLLLRLLLQRYPQLLRLLVPVRLRPWS